MLNGTEAKIRFVLLQRRWVVERRFGWNTLFRRLALDRERLSGTLPRLRYAAFVCLMLNKIIILRSKFMTGSIRFPYCLGHAQDATVFLLYSQAKGLDKEDRISDTHHFILRLMRWRRDTIDGKIQKVSQIQWQQRRLLHRIPNRNVVGGTRTATEMVE